MQQIIIGHVYFANDKHGSFVLLRCNNIINFKDHFHNLGRKLELTHLGNL